LPRDFTQIPNVVLRDDKLTPTEKLVWIVIKSHEWNGDGCWPSASSIAKETGYHRVTVSRAVRGLEEKEIITVSKQPGRPNLYHCATTPVAEDYKTCSRELQGVQHKVTTPVAQSYTNNTKEEDSIRIHKKNTQEERPKKQEQLKQIKKSFPELQEKFPYRDVPQSYEQWIDWMAEKGKQYKDYHAAFRNWLRPKSWEENLQSRTKTQVPKITREEEITRHRGVIEMMKRDNALLERRIEVEKEDPRAVEHYRQTIVENEQEIVRRTQRLEELGGIQE